MPTVEYLCNLIKHRSGSLLENVKYKIEVSSALSHRFPIFSIPFSYCIRGQYTGSIAKIFQSTTNSEYYAKLKNAEEAYLTILMVVVG